MILLMDGPFWWHLYKKKTFNTTIEGVGMLLSPHASKLLNNTVKIQLRTMWASNRLIGQVGRVFANGLGDLGSIPGHGIPKTLKMVLNTSLLNSQQYKVCIKDKVEQFRERSSTLPYASVVVAIEKGAFGSPATTVANLLYNNHLLLSPADSNNKTDINTFYNKLSSFVQHIPKHNILIIGGDMNAQEDNDRNNDFFLEKSSIKNGEYLTEFSLKNRFASCSRTTNLSG